jgi:hypothetical protein
LESKGEEAMATKDKKTVKGSNSLKHLRAMPEDHPLYKGFIIGIKRIPGTQKKKVDPKNPN